MAPKKKLFLGNYIEVIIHPSRYTGKHNKLHEFVAYHVTVRLNPKELVLCLRYWPWS